MPEEIVLIARYLAALAGMLAVLFAAPVAGPAAAALNATFRDCPHCPLMVQVPGGRFTMAAKGAVDGRKDDDPEGFATKVAAHPVQVRPFAAAVYDVTRDDYAAFSAATRRPARGDCLTWTGDQWTKSPNASWRNPGFAQTGRDPVVCVNYADVGAYLRWLNGKLARGKAAAHPYRLLSWREAEYAAGGGSTDIYAWGDTVGRGKANYGADACLPCKPAAEGADRWLYTSPVGSFPPNGFGLFDATGNVWQWTRDCGAEETPLPASGHCYLQVLHGGSWLASARYLPIGEYIELNTSAASTQVGFRVARDVE